MTQSNPPIPVMSDAAAALQFVGQNLEPKLVEKDGATFLITPAGMRHEDITEKLERLEDRPRRQRGTTTMHDIDSFVAWVNRQKAPESVIFADKNKPQITAIIDYPTETPYGAGEHSGSAWGEYRGALPLQLHESWKAWMEADEVYVSQAKFAAFIEDRFGDLLVPPSEADQMRNPAMVAALSAVGATKFADPLRMLEVARGLEVHENSAVKNKTDLSTGEVQIVYESTNNAGSLNVPRAFLLAIPVFDGGPAFQVSVRLRLKVGGGVIAFAPFIHRPDLILEAAFKDIVALVKAGVGDTPIFHGVA